MFYSYTWKQEYLPTLSSGLLASWSVLFEAPRVPCEVFSDWTHTKNESDVVLPTNNQWIILVISYPMKCTWLSRVALTSTIMGGDVSNPLKSPHMAIWWTGSYMPILLEGTNCVDAEFILLDWAHLDTTYIIPKLNLWLQETWSNHINNRSFGLAGGVRGGGKNNITTKVKKECHKFRLMLYLSIYSLQNMYQALLYLIITSDGKFIVAYILNVQKFIQLVYLHNFQVLVMINSSTN